MVVYGHTPVPEPEWLNRTINIDTGCVFGGRLTALRYPERELVVGPGGARSTPSRRGPSCARRGQRAAAVARSSSIDDVLDIDDVLGKRIIATRLHHNVTIREENATAALEVMSRFAANPKWLDLPAADDVAVARRRSEPGCSSTRREAFAYYPRRRACRRSSAKRSTWARARSSSSAATRRSARRRFGVDGEGDRASCYTRTGRRFFDDAAAGGGAARADSCGARRPAGCGTSSRPTGSCLDCELMPWSAKAQELLRSSTPPSAPRRAAALGEAVAALGGRLQRAASTCARLLGALREPRGDCVERYVDAYRRYCWPVESLDDLKLAPFHLLATEGAVHVDKDHVWHMETLGEVCAAADAGILLRDALPGRRPHRRRRARRAASRWWEELTGARRRGHGRQAARLRRARARAGWSSRR